jgi:hypothetical protein
MKRAKIHQRSDMYALFRATGWTFIYIYILMNDQIINLTY